MVKAVSDSVSSACFPPPLLKMNLKTLSQVGRNGFQVCVESCALSHGISRWAGPGAERTSSGPWHMGTRASSLCLSFTVLFFEYRTNANWKVSPLVGAEEAVSDYSPFLLRRHPLSHLLTQPSPPANWSWCCWGQVPADGWVTLSAHPRCALSHVVCLRWGIQHGLAQHRDIFTPLWENMPDSPGEASNIHMEWRQVIPAEATLEPPAPSWPVSREWTHPQALLRWAEPSPSQQNHSETQKKAKIALTSWLQSSRKLVQCPWIITGL